MTDADQNRLSMHRTVLDLLDKPENRPLWENQPPLIFTTKVNNFRKALARIETLAREQENLITGLAERKKRAKTDLENTAHSQGRLIAVYFKDKGREDHAAEIGLPLSTWQRFRDQSLHIKARLLLDRLRAAAAADAPGIADYGVSLQDIDTLENILTDYANVIASPASSIAGRKALTAALPPAFKEIASILTDMDSLAPRLTASTPGGSTFAAAYKAARVIRNLGHTAPAKPDPEEEPTNP